MARVYHADLYGLRSGKYAALNGSDVSTTAWREAEPRSPQYLFVPRDYSLEAEYAAGWKITDAMPVYSVGIVTARDKFVLDFDRDRLIGRIREFVDSRLSDEAFREKYGLREKPHWTVAGARNELRNDAAWESTVVECCYRPFDVRWLCYHEALLERARTEIMRHMRTGGNLAVHTCRQVVSAHWMHALATAKITDDCYVSSGTRERGYMFPCYLHAAGGHKRMEAPTAWPPGTGGRVPNTTRPFVNAVETHVGMAFVPDGTGDLRRTFGPEDVFHYVYAVFHSPSYRERYADFLRADFPRVPVTSDAGLFRALCSLGAELVGFHLLEAPALADVMARFPVAGDNAVAAGYPKYFPPGQRDAASGTTLSEGRVYVNRTQYFDGAPPDIWQFTIGGYQVCAKWLKDRRGRKLTFDDLTHYQKVVVALAESIRLMGKVDEAIAGHGGWPLK